MALIKNKASDCGVLTNCFVRPLSGLQATDVNHDARISALEENGGSGGTHNGKEAGLIKGGFLSGD